MKLPILFCLSFFNSIAAMFAAEPAQLLEGLVFHAPFDGTADAGLAAGDGRIHSAPPSRDPAKSKPGVDPKIVAISSGNGRYGDALHFKKKSREMVFFHADKNVGYREKDWSGTISMWLSLNPADLKQQYADPIQITDKKYDDAALWVDFTKNDTPPHFRLGVFADKSVWNPDNLKLAQIPEAKQPVVRVQQPFFARDKWTHVVMTFSGFNSESDRATANLYLNGRHQGTLKDRRQVFTWNMSKATIRLGLGYVGLLDELAIFNRALNPDEVRTLYKLPFGLKALTPTQPN